MSLFRFRAFWGNDLVYGTGRKSDVLTQAGQVVHKPMYELAILSFDEDMTQSGAYQMDGYYIEGTQILENQLNIIVLRRTMRLEVMKKRLMIRCFSIIEAIKRLQA